MALINDLQEQIRDLLASQNLAVVATQNECQPYTSLVAFLATPDLRNLYFVTPKSTRKFSNLSNDPRVAVLVNNASNQSADFHRAISVTVIGRAVEMPEDEKGDVLERYLMKHPHLEDFAHSPSCALIQVICRSYFLVRNFQQVTEIHISQ